MKRVKIFSAVSAVILALAFAGCSPSVDDPGSSGGSGSGSGSGGGSADLSSISVDMVDVITKSVTVTGKKNENNYEGVFTEGREVTLSPFSMGKYEVTQELYEACMTGEKINGADLDAKPWYCFETSSYKTTAGETQKKRPVEAVTWYDAVYFCNILTEKKLSPGEKVYEITDITLDDYGHIKNAKVVMDRTKKGYRLPTEAEWEFAARGGDSSKEEWDYMFSGAPSKDGVKLGDWSNSGLDSVGWYSYNVETGTTGDYESSSVGTHEVGKKKANSLGIYDMSGNVAEWCYDWLYAPFDKGSVTDPAGPETGSLRITRGGCWNRTAGPSSVCYRDGAETPTRRSVNMGFRLARSK